MQDEYEEAVQDEVHKTLNTSKIAPETPLIKRKTTALPTELLNNRPSVTRTRNGASRQAIQNLSEENQSFISSDSSDYGMIDGEITKKIIDDLELSSPSPKDNNPAQIVTLKSIENIEGSRRISDSSKNNTADTSNGSTSLLDVKKLQSLTGRRNKNISKNKSNENVDMDLTGNSGTMLKVTTVNKLLPKQVATVCEEVKQKKRSVKQKLFTEDLVASSDNDFTKLSSDVSNHTAASCEEMSNLKLSSGKSTSNKSVEDTEVKDDSSETSVRRTNRRTAKQKLFVSPNPAANDGSTMSSLRLSSDSSIANERENSKETSEQKRKTNNLPEASPPKIKRQEGAAKRPTRRKLYNPDEPLNGSYLKVTEDSPNDKKTKKTFKKPTIPLTPVLLTTNAKRFLNEKKDQVDDEAAKAKTPTTPVKRTQTKLKTDRKKATAATGSEDKRKTRSSSFYFDKTPIKSSQKKVKKKSSIVCTRLHKPEVEVFQQIVKKLGGFYVEDEVTNSTTHLVAGEPKRTINLLRAVARGCWILKHEWVEFDLFYFPLSLNHFHLQLLKSLEAGKWLPEEEYELTEFSGAVQVRSLVCS